jgi:sulfur-oxidizing protein SoxY
LEALVVLLEQHEMPDEAERKGRYEIGQHGSIAGSRVTCVKEGELMRQRNTVRALVACGGGGDTSWKELVVVHLWGCPPRGFTQGRRAALQETIPLRNVTSRNRLALDSGSTGTRRSKKNHARPCPQESGNGVHGVHCKGAYDLVGQNGACSSMSIDIDAEVALTVIRHKLNRRDIMVGAGTLFGVAAFPLGRLRAQVNPVPWQEVLTQIVGGAKPLEGKVTVEIPELVENGNIVPISISVVSPMADTDYVKAIHIISTGNPLAYVAGFHFTPLSGKASVATRIRLNGTQEVISVAEFSNGKFLIGRRNVEVAIGCCSGAP